MGNFWFFRSSWTHCAQKFGDTWHFRVSWRALLSGFALPRVSSECCPLWFFSACETVGRPELRAGEHGSSLVVCRESLHCVVLAAPSNLGFQGSVCDEVVLGWSARAGRTASSSLWYRISKWWRWDCRALPSREGGCLASPTCLTHYLFSHGSAQRCTIKNSYLVFSLRSFQCRELILEVIDLSSEWIVGGIWRYGLLFLLSLWFSKSVAGVSFY